MSGKKSCEVAAVLKQGEKVRGMTNGIYRREIEKDLRSMDEIFAEVTSLINKLGDVSAELNDAALNMFGSGGRDKSSALSALKKSIDGYVPSRQKGENILAELSAIDRETQAADREGEAIRRAISNKEWYCDDEFRQAKELSKKYRTQGERRRGLADRTKNLLQAEHTAFNDISSKFAQAKNLAAQILDMNATASRRMQADEQRQKLRETLKEIPNEQAQKFFADEFAEIKATITAVEGASDANVIAEFKGHYQKISAFAVKLQERVALWEKQKRDAEDVMSEVRKLADFSLIGPIEYYNDGENGARDNLLIYLKKYGGKDLTKIYDEELRQINNMMAKEDFLACREMAEKIRDMLAQAREEGIALQSKMLTNTEFAGTVSDVMERMGYDIDLSPINDNPIEGYRLTCKAGAEIIDFTELSMGDDGQPVMNVDHTEPPGGSCAHSWQDIGREFKKDGIPLGDVKLSSGKSVLRAVQGTTKETQARQTLRG